MNARHVLLIGAIFLTTTAFGESTITRKSYLADQFGVKGDGKTLDTAAIQRALDVCGQAGGGIVRLRPGVYLTGPIFLRTHTELRLDAGATIQAVDVPESQTNSEKAEVSLGLINATGISSAAITGNGTIDGGQKHIWNSSDTNQADVDVSGRTGLVVFSNCTNVKYEDVTLQNHLGPHLVFVGCEKVSVSGTVAETPKGDPAVEAFVVDSSRNVDIHDCLIIVDGDGIAVRSSADRSHSKASSEHISVRDCGFLRGRGLAIRNKTSGNLQDVAVSNCSFQSGTTGISIELAPTSGGMVEDLVFRNLKMQDVEQPIRFRYLESKMKAEAKAASASRKPLCRNITVENLSARGAMVAGEISGSFVGSISNVSLRKVTIAARKGMCIQNAQKIEFKDSKLEIKQGGRLDVDANSSVTGL